MLSDKAFGTQPTGLINLHNPKIGPRWWGKIDALQYCDERGMWLVDLDTTIFKFPEDPEQSTFNSDFYNPGSYGSGFCYLTKEDADAVWTAYNKIGPPLVQERFSGRTPETLGDQAFIASVLGDRPIFPEDQVCSFKKHVRKRGGVVPSTAYVVCFHGKPRPWSISELSPPSRTQSARVGRSSVRD